VAAFDIQKIKNPEYPELDTRTECRKIVGMPENMLLHRDNHSCQSCKGRSKDPILQTHHIVSRQIGGMLLITS